MFRPLEYVHSYFFLFSAKEKDTLRKEEDSDSSTSAKLGAGGSRAGRPGRDHHAGGQWREEGTEEGRGSSRCAGPPSQLGVPKSREGQPGGRWARPPPLTRPRRPRRPLPPGPARRPDRAAAEWPSGGAEGRAAGPCRLPPRPSRPTTRRWRGEGLRTPQPDSGHSARPAVPTPARPGHQPELLAPPTGTGSEGRGSTQGSEGPGLRAALLHPSFSSDSLVRETLSPQKCPQSACGCLPGRGAAATLQSLD